MEFQIRQAHDGDAGALTDLLRGFGWFARLENESRESVMERLARHLRYSAESTSHTIRVAESMSGELLGYAAVHWLPYLILRGPEGFVSELFIVEEAREQGIGSALLDAIVEEAKERGCVRLQLLNMRERESYQRGFYTSRGWEERPEAADFVLRL